MKYGVTPVELIREISDIVLTERQRKDALRELTEYFGRPDGTGRRSSAGMPERRILARYFMTLKELMREVGFQTRRDRQDRAAGKCS